MSCSPYNLVLGYSLLLLAALLTTACESADQRVERRVETGERARERTQQHRIRIPKGPTHLLRNYDEPRYSVRQAFLWGPYTTEWRLMVVDYAADHAGFHVRRAFSLPPQRDDMVLFFELSPPEAMHSLALGLIDDTAKDSSQISVLSIAPYRIDRRTPSHWEAFSIPLHAFDSETFRVLDQGDRQPSGDKLDWDNIRGIHLIRFIREPDHSRQIILRNFQFAPELWVRGLQTGREP